VYFGVVFEWRIVFFQTNKSFTMKQKDNSGSKGNDGTTTAHKGESQQSHQKGAESVSNKSAGKHSKDDSGGGAKNTTKKQENSI
jgi:hypothetical protein